MVASATRATATMYAAVRMSTSWRSLMCVHGLEGAIHDALQAVVDAVLGPEEALHVLDPLEVADRHAAGVAQDVGDDEDAAVVQDLVGLRGGRPVGGLGDDLGLDLRRVGAGDLVLERGGDEDVAVELEQLVVRDLVGAGEADDGAVLGLPGAHLGRIEAGCVVDAAGRVAHRDDHGTLGLEQRRRDAPGIAVALDRPRGPPPASRPWRCAHWMRVKTAPRAVASLRPSEPPTAIGLPVTTPGIV